MFRLNGLILFISLHLCYCVDQSCVTERSIVNTNGKIYNIAWKSTSSFRAVVLSDPPCLDENGNLVVRTCLNGTWIGEDLCRYIENTLCPPKFIRQEGLCIFATEPHTWKRNCPYPGASTLTIHVNNSVWLPVKRQIPFGPYEYILPGEHYGLDVSDEYSSEVIEGHFNSDCVITSNVGVEFTSCNSLHSHVCSYKYNQFLYRCPNGCVPGGLGSNYCYCKVFKNVRKGHWCNNLAIPRYSYERTILQKLAADDTCWVGNFPGFNAGYFLHLAVNKHGWNLHKNDEVNCAICQSPPIFYHKVDMMLKFNAQSGKLYLNVYSPESIFKDDDDELIYCFTDATDKLKKRVDVDNVWNSNNSSGRRLKVFRVSISDDGPGSYWCEAFQLPMVSLIKSNTVIAYKDLKGHEYSLRLVIYNICRFSLDCETPSASFIINLTKNLFDNKFFSRFVKKVRLFHIYNIDIENERVDILVHITTQSRLPVIAEYFAISRNLEWFRLKQVTIVFFRSSEYCLPDVTQSANLTLYWQLSALGIIRTPDQVCVRQNGTPVRRQCKGDFVFGSRWGEVDGTCSKDIKLSSKTELLHSLVFSDLSADVRKNISAVTENSTDLTPLDLHYLAETLSKASVSIQNISGEFVAEMGQIIDNLMKSDTTTMKESQILLNATDEILDSFENVLASANLNEDLFLFKRSNLIIQISRPFLNNISGLVLCGDDDESFLNVDTLPLYANSSLNEVLLYDDLEVAAYVPEKLLDVISQNLTDKSNITIIITIFYVDKFFNSETDDDTTVESRIVSVSIPGFGEYLEEAIPIVFKSKDHKHKQDCVFWNYGISSETHSGYWSGLGGDYMGHFHNSSLEICSFSHLTNFALLVMNREFSASDDKSISYNLTLESHDKILTIISDIGCSLSLLGILCIFVTGLIFQTWREKVGTRILLQLCITIFLQIIFFNMANVRTSRMKLSVGYCTIVGVVLHYLVISEFSWMLVAAVLQFFRFVKVIGPLPNRIILKAMVVGWGLPFIPVIFVSAINYHNYSKGVQGFCYPHGLGLYLGILLPIVLIVTANLSIFIVVVRNVFVLSVESRGNSQAILKRQICLTVLLFFLLGLPWIFGFVAEILSHDSALSFIFMYLFCITATLQGFVLFLFYVVLDKSTRTLWFGFVKKLIINRKSC